MNGVHRFMSMDTDYVRGAEDLYYLGRSAVLYFLRIREFGKLWICCMLLIQAEPKDIYTT